MVDKKHSEAVCLRFLKAMKQIISQQIAGVKTQKEFVDAIGEYTQNISKMQALTRYPTVEMICIMCHTFEVNPGWLLLGHGDMFTASAHEIDIRMLEERVTALEKAAKKSKK